MPKDRPDALTQATKLLAASDKTRAQLVAALVRKGYPEDEANAAAARAQALGYLDDARVAARRARDDLDDGWAGEVLHARLVATGLEASVATRAIEDAIAQAGWRADAAARVLLTRRKLDGPKAARFLASRGFEEALIQQLLDLPD